MRNCNRSIVVVAALLASGIALPAGTVYQVNYNGPNIDMTGFIEVGVTGSFSPTAFNSQVIDYSITASANGAEAFTFTTANSTWGGPGLGANVTVDVTTSAILVSAATGDNFNPGNAFLFSDIAVNGCCVPNLRIFQTDFGFRTPNNIPAGLLFDTVASPFALAQVPEPTSFLLISAGAGLLLLRRKAR